MRLIRRLLIGSLLLCAVAVWWRADRVAESVATAGKIVRSDVPVVPAASRAGPALQTSTSTSPADPLAPGQIGSREILRRLAYAQAWNEPQPPVFAAFRDWAGRYQQAATANARSALEAEGIAFARERRPVMRELIVDDPQRALSLTVPATVRQTLPAAVLAELETRVAGKGDYELLATTFESGASPASAPLRRVAFIDRVEYRSHVYGRRAEQTTKEGASLHGIALDGELALHESPLRVLEPGEIPASAPAATCPVSDLSIAKLDLAAGVNRDTLDVVEVAGSYFGFCGGAHMLEDFAQRLADAESSSDPRVTLPLSGAAEPRTAADATTAWTTGNTKVLVIRVDFSDLPTEFVTAAAAQARMDNDVRPFFEAGSYGLDTLTSTITTKVYRMPQTGEHYGTLQASSALHADARAAAGADYDIAGYDRVAVVFPAISQFVTTIGGRTFIWAGMADIRGRNVWLNGYFGLRELSHELGHTYGLNHANLWQVSDGNPVSSGGTSVEYKDPFDAMGDSSSVDARHHYNPWSKNRLGWLPDSAVLDVTKSGTYRVYRFDSKVATFDHPLALRVYRDGLRSYWIGLRQNFTANDSLTNGAYVIWGFGNLQQSQLLDMTTPGASASDAALPVGSTFNDLDYGIKIKPVARGGSEPAQYLDVEVTVPATPLSSIAVWGGTLPTQSVPGSTAGATAIAAGVFHALALKPDGTVVAWGMNDAHQCDVPADLRDVVAVAAWANVSGAVKRDGTIRMWGDDKDGQVSAPAGLEHVRQLVIGSRHAAALKTDGSVMVWGGTAADRAVPDAGPFIQIAAGGALTVALRLDGTVAAWGSNPSGRPPPGLSGLISVATGGGHVLGLKADGSVIAWGSNTWGETDLPANLTGVVALAADTMHSLALKSDGTVVGWGGQAGTGIGPASIPANLSRARAIIASDTAGTALLGSAPLVTSQPEGKSATAGASITLSAGVAASTAATYQWRKNGIAILGANDATLTLDHAQATDTGIYTLTVNDSGALVTSAPAVVLITGVATAPTGGENARLANLSTRAVVGTGGDILIPGIAISGSGQKQLIVRVSGPALAAQGVAGTLARPQLRFYSGSNLVAENIGWSSGGAANTNALLAAFAQVGLPAFPNGSADCALLATVNPGVYTATISGVGETTGAALVEVYEFGTSGSRLAALSCRARVGTGGDVLIPGITIAGSGTKRVIIRASGPALADQGVNGVLAKPLLEIFGESGKIAGNAGWSSAANVTDIMLATAAVGLGPFTPGSSDCAVLLSLSPGNYTAKVSGLNNTTGVALVEVYEVP